MDCKILDKPVLVRVWLFLILSSPLPTPDQQLPSNISELVHTMCSCEDSARCYEGSTTLVQVNSLSLLVCVASCRIQHLLVKDSTHVGPLTKLRFGFFEALDSDCIFRCYGKLSDSGTKIISRFL